MTTESDQEPSPSGELSDERLEQIHLRFEAATPGPWRAAPTEGCRSIGPKMGTHRQAQHQVLAYTTGLRDDDQDRANAEFIANARTDVADLHAYVMRLKSTVQPNVVEPSTGPDDPYAILNLDEVCKELRRSRVTLFRWIKSGRLRATKIGGQWTVRRHVVEEMKDGG